MQLFGQYLETDQTLTNGEIAPIQLTVDGKLKTDSAGGGGGGDASAANQVTGNASLASIDGKFTTLNAKDFATETTLSSLNGKVTACNTGAVTISSSVLPTGAATESTLSFISSQLGSIDTNTGLPLGQKTLFKNFGANATLNVKSASGSVYSCSCMNLNASARYFQLWNSSTTAGSGTLLFTFLVPANSQIVIGNDYFHINGILFDTGIAFGFSTTATTYTAGTAADQISTVIYF